MLAELVRKARSVRRFVEGERIPVETLRGWVDTARFVPSAANLQPLRYRLVHTPQECAKLFPFTAWAGYLTDWVGPVAGERPAAYILILSPADKPKPDTDTGIAAQTLQLLAAADGYGACMLGALRRDDIHRELALPPGLNLQLALAFGRPAETVVVESIAGAASGPEAVKYWRDERGVHHVPKRSLPDILV